MILTCPSCGTRYRADPANFSAPGRNVRCAKCGNVWFQPAPEPEPATAANVPEPARLALPGSSESQTSGGWGERSGSRANEEQGSGDWRQRIADAGLQPVAIIAVLVFIAALGWAAQHYRQAVVRLWPESARFYTAVGLPVNVGSIAIQDVDLRQETQDGTPVLSVTGRLVNITDRDQPIPRLRVVVFDHTRRELYRWTFDPGFASLAAGAEHDFGTTLPNPPPDAQSVNVNLAADDTQ